MRATEQERPMRFAHRGLVRRAPENSLEAVAAAFELGCEGVEIDVRSTRDRRVVLAHDADVARTVSGGPDDGRSEQIANLSWAELVELSFPYANHLLPALPPGGIREEELYPRILARQLGQERPHAEEYRRDRRVAHPLLFEDLLRWCRVQSREMLIEVECKETGLAAGLKEVFDRVGGGDRCILFSGMPEVVEELCAGFPRGERRSGESPEGASPPWAPRTGGVRVGANVRRLTPEGMEDIARLQLDVVDLNAFEASRRDIDLLHEAGRMVLANLGDLPEWWETLERWGFDGFKTNYAEEYTAWARRRRAPG